MKKTILAALAMYLVMPAIAATVTITSGRA